MVKKKNFMNIPKQPINQRILKYLITVLIVVGSIWSASGLEITPERFLTAPSKVWILVTAMFPLDLSQEAIDRIVPKVGESLFIAWAGTVIGAIFSFPISFLAANNVSLNSFSRATKQVLNVIRAFPELILAFVLLPITGLGPLTGTLAVGIHSIGTLGKLSSEVIEGIDEGPLESIKSSGGNKLNELFFEQLGIRKPDFFLEAIKGSPSETIGDIISKIDKVFVDIKPDALLIYGCLLYTSPSPRDRQKSRMPSSA